MPKLPYGPTWKLQPIFDRRSPERVRQDVADVRRRLAERAARSGADTAINPASNAGADPLSSAPPASSATVTNTQTGIGADVRGGPPKPEPQPGADSAKPVADIGSDMRGNPAETPLQPPGENAKPVAGETGGAETPADKPAAGIVVRGRAGETRVISPDVIANRVKPKPRRKSPGPFWLPEEEALRLALRGERPPLTPSERNRQSAERFHKEWTEKKAKEAAEKAAAEAAAARDTDMRGAPRNFQELARALNLTDDEARVLHAAAAGAPALSDAQDDVLSGSVGNDTLAGSSGNDMLTEGAPNEISEADDGERKLAEANDTIPDPGREAGYLSQQANDEDADFFDRFYGPIDDLFDDIADFFEDLFGGTVEGYDREAQKNNGAVPDN